jgi:hypothetical protein
VNEVAVTMAAGDRLVVADDPDVAELAYFKVLHRGEEIRPVAPGEGRPVDFTAELSHVTSLIDHLNGVRRRLERAAAQRHQREKGSRAA